MTVFDYQDYRKFLKDIIDLRDGQGRGFRSYLSQQIGVQRTFISQVLNGDAHFNLEHGEAVGRTLSLSDEEIDFFLLLISFARAGTFQLRDRLQNQINAIRDSRMAVRTRFKEKDALSSKDKLEYYSSWLYGAIRVLLTIPQFQTRESVERYFSLPREQVSQAIEFLVSRKLVIEKDGELTPTEKHMFLNEDSKLVTKHHTNWRMRAIQSLDFERRTDLHFSAVNSLSREDVQKIRENLMKTIEEIRKTVRDSKEECLYSLCVDFFET